MGSGNPARLCCGALAMTVAIAASGLLETAPIGARLCIDFEPKITSVRAHEQLADSRPGTRSQLHPAFLDAPRCGARNRRGLPCMAPALRGRKRCLRHGGLSCGPRTPEGRARSRAAHLRHGYYCREIVAIRREVRGWVRAIRFAIQTADAAHWRLSETGESAAVQALSHVSAGELAALYRKIAVLLNEKLAQPLDVSSDKAISISSARLAAWARLCPAFCDLGRAVVRAESCDIPIAVIPANTGQNVA